MLRRQKTRQEKIDEAWYDTRTNSITGDNIPKEKRAPRYITIKHTNFIIFSNTVWDIINAPGAKKYKPILDYAISHLEYQTNLVLDRYGILGQPATTKKISEALECSIRTIQYGIKYWREKNIIAEHKKRYYVNPNYISHGRTFPTKIVQLFRVRAK